jgi:hypothetical protein
MEIGEDLSTYLHDFLENYTLDFTTEPVAEVCQIIPFPHAVQSLTRDPSNYVCRLALHNAHAAIQPTLAQWAIESDLIP